MSRKIVFSVPLALALVLLTGLMIVPALAQSGGTPQMATENQSPVVLQSVAEPASALLAGITSVGGAGGYTFGSSSGAYTEITGGTVYTTGTGGALDDESFNAINLDFTFKFNGVNYTQISINNNGFIAMGASASSSYYPISTGTSNNVVSALGGDLQGQGGSELMSKMEGISPNRVFTIQWKNYRAYAAVGDDLNFQIKLYETSDKIEFVYGSFTQNATNRTREVGLRGNSNADFNNRKTTTSTTGDWAASLAGTLNNDAMGLTSTLKPTSGLTYTFTPPQSPDFSSSYKKAPTAVVVGDPITYTLYVTNSGYLAASNTNVTDPIPSGTTYVPGSVLCSGGTCGYDTAGTAITWTGSLAAKNAVTITFAVDTDATPCGSSINNTAVISDPAILAPKSMQATTQLVYVLPVLAESFDGAIFPPTDWGRVVVTATGTPTWTRETAGTSPTILPHSGAAMAKFNSYNATSGGSARLSTPALDLSTVTAPALKFWMSYYNSSTNDRITIQVSTDGGTTWTNLATFARYDASCSTACWKQNTVDLSAYAGQPSVIVGFLGISAFGYNIFLDDVSIAEPWYPCPFVSVAPDWSGSFCPGSYVDYPLTVRNINDDPDTVDMTYAGNAWPTSVSPTSLDLGIAGSGPVTVSVHMPWAAAPLTSDMVVVTGTAQTSGFADSAQIKTTALLATGYSDYADVPVPRRTRDHSVVYYDGKLFKFGGYDGSARNYTNWYDIASNTWFTGTNMPANRYWIDGVEIGGKIYIAGGYDTAARNTLYIYNPISNTWILTGTALPTNLYAYAGVALGGKYYVMGGYTGSVYTSTLRIYDPVSNSWSTGAPMSVARRYAAAGAIGGKIYVAGGMNSGTTYVNTAEVYDPGTNTWSPVASLPPFPGGTAPVASWVRTADGVLHDRYLVMAGGYSADSSASSYVLAYDAVTNKWGWQPYMSHVFYSAEGDSDGTNFWFVSGRIYEGGVWGYSRYTTRLTECAACVSASGADFTVTPPFPRPNMAATFNGTVAAGSPAITYEWDFGDNSYGSGQLPTHSYATTGTFTVVMTATNCDGASVMTATHDVTVMTGPAISVLPSSLSSTQCPNAILTQTLAICNVGDDPLTWAITQTAAWLSAEPISGTTAAADCSEVEVTFDSTGLIPGDYLADLVIDSNDILNPVITVPVTLAVAGPPTNVDFSWSPNSPEANQTVAFTGTATSLVPLDYAWDFGDGATGSGAHLTHTYTLPGWHTVVMTATSCGNSITATHNVGVVYCQSAQENFESAFPPTGWNVVNNGGTCVWQRNDAFATQRPNYAGGQGFAADADADKCGSGTTMNTELRSPVMDLSNADAASLHYVTSYDWYASGEYANTDISTDGGATWTNLVNWTTDHSANGPGELVNLDLTPYVGQNDVMVRFHYYAPGWDYWWEVDQVNMTTCYVPGAAPDIAVTPTSFDQVLNPDQTADQTVNIANRGLAALDWTADVGCGTPASWLSITPTLGTVPGLSNADATITFDSTGLALGFYDTHICINSNDPDEPQVQITATLEVTGTPDIAITAPPLETTLCQGDTDVITFTVCNNGTAALTWQLREEPRGVGMALSKAEGTPGKPAGRSVELALQSVPASSPALNAPVAPEAAISLVLDDGSIENNIGIGGTWEFIYLNRFTPYPAEFPFALNQIQIYFAGGTTGVQVGDDIVLAVYENTTGNTDPAVGSNFLASFTATVQTLNAWNVYDLATPVVLNGPGDVLIGVVALEVPGTAYFPAALDTTATQQRSWAGWWLTSPPPTPPTLPPDDTWMLIDDYLAGNWMVRGYGQTEFPWLTEVPTSGLVLPGACTEVAVTFDSDTLPGGDYLGSLVISSNDPDTPEITLPVTMTVNVAPSGADFTWQPDPAIVNQTVTFTGSVALGSPPLAYSWDFGDGGAGAGAHPTHAYAADGDYTTIMTASNTCGEQVVTHTITVVPACEPISYPNVAWTPITPTVGSVVTFTLSASGTEPIFYRVYFGDGAYGDGQVVTHTYATAGDYVVQVSIGNACTLPPLDIWHNITVKPAVVEPVADFTATPRSGVAPLRVSFSDLSTNNPTAWTWDFGDSIGNSAAQNPVYTYTVPGVYTVTLDASNAAGSDREVKARYITVTAACEPVANADFARTPFTPTVGAVVTFTGSANGTPPITFEWEFDGVVKSGATVTYTFAATGTYTVIMTATNDCGYQAITHDVTVEAAPPPPPKKIYLPIILKNSP